MTKKIVIVCDAEGCEKSISFERSDFSLNQMGWEYRSGGRHVCPDHVKLTSDNLRENEDEQTHSNLLW